MDWEVIERLGGKLIDASPGLAFIALMFIGACWFIAKVVPPWFKEQREDQQAFAQKQAEAYSECVDKVTACVDKVEQAQKDSHAFQLESQKQTLESTNKLVTAADQLHTAVFAIQKGN